MEDIQHSQTHMTLYLGNIFNWGGNSEHSVESRIMILFYASLASLIPPYNFGTSCGSVWPSMFTFIQPLKTGDYTTCGWWIIQLYRDFFIWSFIFEFSFRFCFNAHGVVTYLIALRFDLAAPTRRVEVFFSHLIC